MSTGEADLARLMKAQRVLALKIVYYGPGLSGKTTNLESLHSTLAEADRGDLLKIDTESERTLFFDYFAAELGMLSGFKLKADLFTVPGQSFYHSTRRVVLEGADGVVFVADSDPSREDANIASFDSLQENLASFGRGLTSLPIVLQWNKRDLPNALPIRLLQRTLNPHGFPEVEAVAMKGEGVKETHALIQELVLKDLRNQARTKRARKQ